MSSVPFGQGVRTVALALAIIVAAVLGEWWVAAARSGTTPSCRQVTPLSPLPALPEASALALSRRSPYFLWSINDSGAPYLYALNRDGSLKGKVQVMGAAVHDWEALAVARCPGGNCVYIGDIGDNDRARRSIAVYRVPEPDATWSTTAAAEVFLGQYPDGPHDAEALFVTPQGGIFIVTKEKPAAVYRFPEARGSTQDSGSTVTLEHVSMLPVSRVTDAVAYSDGRTVAIRTHDEVVFYSSQNLVAGLPERSTTYDLSGIHEPQGEGVAMGEDGVLYLAGEGGEAGHAGTFASMQCKVPGLD